MRQTFFATLADLAREDERIMLLTGDLGWGFYEPFAAEFPSRFINAGCAEQNMIGVATGLAEAGFIPFCYSITPFATLRPLEFIRNGPVLHNLPVRIVGVGRDDEYGLNGQTHYAYGCNEAMAAIGLPAITPYDKEAVVISLKQSMTTSMPLYFSLSKN